jgi:hypothetical protein
MTISTTASRISYTGNGSTVDFSFPYPVLVGTDLVVIETIITTGVETVQVITTDYTVALVGGATATVTAVTAPASTVTWTIYRNPAVTQGTDFTDNDPLPAASIEDALDRLTMIEQRSRSLVDRSLKQPEGDTADIDYLPAKVDRASKYLIFDADGNPTVSTGTGTVSSVSSAMIEDDAVTLAKMAGGTDGNLITYDAAGDPAYVLTGTAAQVLTSNGPGAAPTFQTPAALAAGAVNTANLADDAVTLAKIAAGTDGELITWDAAGDPATVPVGTSGHVLTSNGVGAAPTFQAPSVAGMVLISTTDVSGSPSTVDLTGFDATKYDDYCIVLGNIRSSSDAKLHLRTSTDGGSTFSSQNVYRYAGSGVDNSNGASTVYGYGSGSSSDAQIQLTKSDVGNAGNEGVSGHIFIYKPHLAMNCRVHGSFSGADGLGHPFSCNVAGHNTAAADVDAVRLLWSTGNFADRGTINFYGIKNA